MNNLIFKNINLRIFSFRSDLRMREFINLNYIKYFDIVNDILKLFYKHL